MNRKIIAKKPAAKAKAAPAAAAPAAASPGEETEARPVSELIWDICSPLKHTEFEPPWSDISLNSWNDLNKALADPAVMKIAQRVCSLAWAECTKTLIRESPPLYRVMHGIRGIVAAAAPESLETAAAAPAAVKKDVLPGVALVYETFVA